MTGIEELENRLLDQIGKLNDDSIFSNKEDATLLVERSKAIGQLADTYISMKRTSIDEKRVRIEAVKYLSENGGLYEKYLGIEDKR